MIVSVRVVSVSFERQHSFFTLSSQTSVVFEKTSVLLVSPQEINVIVKENKIRLKCKTLFFKENGDISSEALIELVVVRNEIDSIRLVRKLPEKLKKTFSLLEKGPLDEREYEKS